MQEKSDPRKLLLRLRKKAVLEKACSGWQDGLLKKNINLKTININRFSITLTLLLIAVPAKLLSQEFHGMAVYESKTKLWDMKLEGDGITDEMTKQIREGMIKELEKKFYLDFNQYESVYYEEQKLESPAPAANGFSMSFSSNVGGKTYKNLKEKSQLEEEDFFGKEFLVSDSLKVWNWELQNETKKIGNYTCYKAISIDRVTDEELQKYEERKKKQDTAITSFMELQQPKDRVTTVWYTPEIPVGQGPAKFWGLPGLILEANFDETTILCSKIVLNPKDKTEIKKPKRGKKVTKKEYESLIEKQMEQMKDENGHITIEITR